MTRDIEPSRPDRREIVPDDWTDAQRLELARKIQIVAEKMLDIRLTTHRASVIAVEVLRSGWRR